MIAFCPHYTTLFSALLIGEEAEVYRRLTPLYFPRNEEEEHFAIKHLPADVGNENGEPVIEERQIRISDTLPVKKGKLELINGRRVKLLKLTFFSLICSAEETAQSAIEGFSAKSFGAMTDDFDAVRCRHG